MDRRKNTARTAGAIYFIVVLSGFLYLWYIPSQFKFKGDPSAVVHNFINHERLFRVGIAAELICWVFFLILPVILYQLFKPVHETWARLMVVFVVVQVPLSFANLLNKFAVLSIADGHALPMEQLQVQMRFYLNLYHQGNLVNQIFWGLWLFPFGYLVFKSGFLPKILGILLMAGCFGYLTDFTGSFFFLPMVKQLSLIISTYQLPWARSESAFG
ncbi:DUF4386 domain-containing protein [Pedobacter nutrimenti]|jgi:hypothetical protein|uniref:Uncharacterized protein DUF4386 n=1 Tax=Pedobacter nutrimenti TaxID=1241337 RepID=A0A318UBP0_9SPHI|nr:DUF4386 domain-containing protein [Pedobacter nutrimenti]PYF72652.1 uncharacterized protein DUF4386 [Pedobacter nutrimenti]